MEVIDLKNDINFEKFLSTSTIIASVFFVFLKQLFTQRVGRDFRPRLEKETLDSFGVGVPLSFNE